MDCTKSDEEIVKISKPHLHTTQNNYKTMKLSELVRCEQELGIKTHHKEREDLESDLIAALLSATDFIDIKEYYRLRSIYYPNERKKFNTDYTGITFITVHSGGEEELDDEEDDDSSNDEN